MNRSPHDPTSACLTVHCHTHHVDEDDAGAYRVCRECGHVFPTARALRREHRRVWRDFPTREPLRYRIRRQLVRASRIWTCPHCAHDF